MPDRREEILKSEYYKYYRPSFPSDERTLEVVKTALCIKEETDAIKNAMDEYMKECCLQLLEYVAFNTTDTLVDVSGVKFKYKGEWITKEQLFENFL